jgi:hypothetical protein
VAYPVWRHGDPAHLHQLGLAGVYRFQNIGMLAPVGDGHVGGCGTALAKRRSRPGVGHVDAAGLCRPHGETDEHDGSNSEEKSDPNLDDTELGEPKHFASL